MEKAGRNDPCPCGSGKKFKKCCEDKVKHKKFEASIISSGTPEKGVATDKAAKVSTGFFQRALAPRIPPPHAPPHDHPPAGDAL